MKKAAITLVLLAAIGGSAYAYYKYRNAPVPPTVITSMITRGDITDTVGATGTLQAVTTVQVGTQVSGTIQELYADFNSLVRKGQVLARLDPSLFYTQIEQARANLIRAQADLERLKVTLDDARTKLARARELSQRQLIPQTELEAAEVAVRSAEAQIRSAEAQVTQAEASLNQNQVNLAHTVIKAPIDGLVVSRNVDVGQTVAASMQAPTLFVLAADLSQMQVIANLDESDVGRIRPGQRVTFRVDAYPAEDFVGTVSQVRLQPIVQQNVVSYATVIDVPNPQLKLKPGMTANVNVEIARRTNVLRIPNTALRFRPTNDIFAALGQAPPQAEVLMRQARQAGQDGPTESAGRAGQAGQARFQNLTPEQRAQLAERLAARGVSPDAPSAAAAAPDEAAQASSAVAANPHATTIDALFGPLPAVESVGRVWIQRENSQLAPVPVRLGISDGQATELIDGDLSEGDLVVTAVNTGNEARPTPANSGRGFPFGAPMGAGERVMIFQGAPAGGGGGRGR